jgi:glycosyltransferase involved in cell wall biosynthesis
MATQPARQFPADPYRSTSAVNTRLHGARILFLVDEISITTDAGTERQILQMIDICNQSGMRPQICVLRETKSLTPEVAGCPITHFPVGKITSSRGLRSLVRLARWIREQNIDILQTFFSEANLIGPYVGRLAGVRVILGSRRNLNHARQDGRSRSRLQVLANRLTTQVLANSQAVLDRTVESERISPKRICVLYNGIDLARMRPAPEARAATRDRLGIADDQILVGNISALRAIKGVQMFVNASAEAYRRDHRLRFLLVGNGDLKVQLNQTIRIYGLQGIIRVHAAVEDVRPYLAAFDVAVLCSQTEGFSNSLLEYMAAGLPIIATDVGGNREALGSSGLLIRPDVHELTTAIHTITAPNKRGDFATASLAKVKEFDLPVARERLTGLYDFHLSQGAARKRPRAQSIAHMAA